MQKNYWGNEFMIWIQNLDYLIQDAERVLCGADLLIDGDRIVAVGTVDPAQAGNAEIISGEGKIAMPGFVNTHTHLYQNMLKGMGDGLRLKPWCEQVTFPFASIIHKEERETDEPKLGYHWAALGAMEMVRSGITSFVDMDIVQDGVLQAWQDIGVRGNLALQLVNKWVPKELMVPDEVRKKKALDIIERWHKNGKLTVSLAPSTPFACTPEFLMWIRDTAKERNLEIFIHISETKWEVEQAKDETGNTPFGYLEEMGFFERPVHAVHCVCVEPEDIEIMKKRKLDVIYNPKSNAKLGSGIAPIGTYLKQGIPVAVSTDGAASNDSLDMFEEMRFGQLLQKASAQNPLEVSVEDMFNMATKEGAKMMNIDAGVLEEGKLADLVLLDDRGVHMQPINGVLQTVFYCAKSSDVDTVIIGGDMVMQDKQFVTVDETGIIDSAVGLSNKAKAQVGKKLDADF
ncbi:amidohydrolase [Clostridia bacterium]|nr:amidohydrolase [Clostridia bacterium]